MLLNSIKLAIRTDPHIPEFSRTLPRYPQARLFSQVSRFLVVKPQDRCSAEEALAHPFFQEYVVEEVRHFSPRGKFKVLRFNLPKDFEGGCCWLRRHSCWPLNYGDAGGGVLELSLFLYPASISGCRDVS